LNDHRDRYCGREIEWGGYVLGRPDLEAGSFRGDGTCSGAARMIRILSAFWFSGPVPGPPKAPPWWSGAFWSPSTPVIPETGKTFKVPGIRAAYAGPLEGVTRVGEPD